MNDRSETSPRSPALQAVLDLTRRGLEARSDAAPASAGVVRKIFKRAERPALPGSGVVPTRLPTCDWIEPVLAEVERSGGTMAALARALADIAPRLAWQRRPGSERLPDRFSHNHANATILGPGGIEERDDVWIGASIMAPGTQYPDHSHPPEEVYLALSAGEWRQNQDEWHTPGPGGLVHNPPDVVHSMRSGATPLLAIWCLLPAPRPTDETHHESDRVDPGT